MLRGAAGGQLPTRKRTKPLASAPDSSQDLGHGLLRLLGERLLEQDVLLEVAVDATLDDAGAGRPRACPPRCAVASATRRSFSTVSASTSSRVSTLGLNAAMCIATSLAVCSSPPVGGHEDADLRGQVGAGLVQVRPTTCSPSRRATRLTSIFSPMVALASSSSSWTVLPLELARASSASASAALVATAWVEDLVGQGDEALALGDEVGLAEDLDEGALAGAGLRGDQAVGGRAALALGHALEALDAQDLLGLRRMSPSASSRARLDVHHPGARSARAAP